MERKDARKGILAGDKAEREHTHDDKTYMTIVSTKDTTSAVKNKTPVALK